MVFLCALLASCRPCGAATPGGVNLQAVVVTTTGLSQPVFGGAPVGEMGKLYISEQNNVAIKILDLATKQFTTFLDLPDIAGGQAGLSAFAFHPDYATNGKFYVNLYDSVDDRVKILEFQRSAENPAQANVASRREIFSFENSSGSHNGGWLGFSPIDGYLYIATGDGGAIGGPLNGLPAQDISSPKGKILRLDVDVDDDVLDDTRNYGIPATNPYVVNGVVQESYAIGLRHPYRASFDRVTGDLYIGDVGGMRYEEINLIPAGSGGGQNFGWRTMEGPFDNPSYHDPHPSGAVDPLYYYEHGSAAAVIGGYVYRGTAIPELVGQYIYTDVVTDAFGTFSYDGLGVSGFVDRTNQLAHPTNVNGYAGVVSFAEDAAGELYFFDRTRGDVFKIVRGPISGDFNRDGFVDFADYSVWQAGFGIDARGDADYDLDTDGMDYLVWQQNFGQGEITPLLAVPEPATFSTAVAALLTVGWWGRATRR